MHRYGYEHDLLELLESLTRQCDKRIERNRGRAAQENQYSEDDVRKIMELDEKIKQLTADSGEWLCVMSAPVPFRTPPQTQRYLVIVTTEKADRKSTRLNSSH